MTWLLRDGDVLATVEERRPGWQASLQGAILLRAPVMVQTLASEARALDVAWCTPTALGDGRSALQVRRITVVGRRRVTPPHLRPGGVVVAPVGTFERWHLRVGDRLEVRTS
jgi:hypothetical protein